MWVFENEMEKFHFSIKRELDSKTLQWAAYRKQSDQFIEDVEGERAFVTQGFPLPNECN